MENLFSVHAVDRDFYAEKLKDFLPADIIDIHTHLWPARLNSPHAASDTRTASWPLLVASENPIEHLQKTYELLFPDKRVFPCVFGHIETPLDDNNTYVEIVAQTHHLPSLLFAPPQWSSDQFEHKLLEGNHAGMKGYLSLVPEDVEGDQICIFDFFPPHLLSVLNKHKMIAMIHIPRAKRLGDPVNLAQLMEIEERWPDIHVIVAHVGRAYCPEDVGDAFDKLADTTKLNFDFSANTNQQVFEQLIDAVGPDRILFGSDLPITRMRMRRVCENGIYVNIVPQGLYGDVQSDRHMRQVDSPEADRLTFFLYEQIDAFRRAAENRKLSSEDIRKVFYENAVRILNPFWQPA